MTTVEILTRDNRQTREVTKEHAHRTIGQRVAMGWPAVGMNFLDRDDEMMFIAVQVDDITGKVWAIYINV